MVLRFKDDVIEPFEGNLSIAIYENEDVRGKKKGN